MRISQFVANPSLWFDEVAVARNVFDRPLRALLFEPLDYGQTAPVGFLLAEKTATLLLGRTDWALRIFPFVASLASLFVFAHLARRLLSAAGAVVSITLFALAFPLVYFTTQTKQYSSDVLASVSLMVCAYYLRTATSVSQRLLLASLGAALPWFSQAGTLVAVAICAVSLVMRPSGEQFHSYRERVGPVVAAWAVSSLSAMLFAVSMMTPDTRAYLQRFWATGFLPLTVAAAMETWWPWDQLRAFIGTGGAGGGRISVLAYPMPGVYFGVACAGLCAIWKRDRAIAWLIATPPLLTLTAAVARQYPFSDRLIVFLVPCFFLAIGGAVEWVRRLPANKPAVAAVTVALLAPAVYGIARTPPPYHTEPIKRVLATLESQRREGDSVYVFYGAVPAVDIYVDQLGLDRAAYYAGGCHRGDNRRYLQELDSFRGHERLWFVVTHALPQFRERDDMLRYLDAIGKREAAFSIPTQRGPVGGTPAEAFLYDLSDPGRLGRATADSLPLDGPNPQARRGCAEGPATVSALRLANVSAANAFKVR